MQGAANLWDAGATTFSQVKLFQKVTDAAIAVAASNN
jgi:hypothetical protein